MLTDRLAKWLSRPTQSRGGFSSPSAPFYISTDIGLTRKENQDRVAVMKVNSAPSSGKPFFVMALSDGMGGMKNGSECAVLALSHFFNSLVTNRTIPAHERLNIAGMKANDAVFDFANGDGGATLSALMIGIDHPPLTLNVGDSRIFSCPRHPEKKFERLTTDDSLEEFVGGHGKDLIQFIGMGLGLKPHISSIPHDGERLLLTSDGAHFIGNEIMSLILNNSIDLQQPAERLHAISRWAGSPDNASIIMVDVGAAINALYKNEETGIEIFDPFGALHLMWLKQEPLIEPLPIGEKVECSIHITPKNQEETISDTKSVDKSNIETKTVEKKVRKPRTKRTKKSIDSTDNQFEIEIIPTNPREEKDDTTR